MPSERDPEMAPEGEEREPLPEERPDEAEATMLAGEAASGPRFTQEDLDAAVQQAASAAQGAKDRRIAALEARMAAAGAGRSPQFRSEADELAWYRQRHGVAAAIRDTELHIAAELHDLSAALSGELGAEMDIRRNDPRLDVGSEAAFRGSLRAIAAEERARARVTKLERELEGLRGGEAPPIRADRNRFEGSSGGARTSVDPSKFKHSGDVFEALEAKDRAQGITRRGFAG